MKKSVTIEFDWGRDKDSLSFPGDLPEIEIEDNPRVLQRLLPDAKRPSVKTGQCESPDLWFQSGGKVFACPRCTEQDVCPMFKSLYSKKALTEGVKSTPFNDDRFHLAAKYWGVRPVIDGEKKRSQDSNPKTREVEKPEKAKIDNTTLLERLKNRKRKSTKGNGK